MRLSKRQKDVFLYSVQGVGAGFVGIFLAAYFAGLPSTAVLHSEPAFRIPLAIIGAMLLLLVLLAFVLAFLWKKGLKSLLR